MPVIGNRWEDVMGIERSGTNEHLSCREQEVLQLIADGYRSGEIASQLVLARSTVKAHVETILRKTNSHSRAAAVAWGFRTGVIK